LGCWNKQACARKQEESRGVELGKSVVHVCVHVTRERHVAWGVETVGFMSERGEIRPLCLHGDHEKSMEREMRETVGC